MARLIWTAESRWWLREIYLYIARDSREAAQRVVRGIFDKAHLLIEAPEIGYRPDPVKHPSVRILLYGHYRIAYKRLPEDDQIYVLGVFHGALDLRRHLRER